MKKIRVYEVLSVSNLGEKDCNVELCIWNFFFLTIVITKFIVIYYVS